MGQPELRLVGAADVGRSRGDFLDGRVILLGGAGWASLGAGATVLRSQLRVMGDGVGHVQWCYVDYGGQRKKGRDQGEKEIKGQGIKQIVFNDSWY